MCDREERIERISAALESNDSTSVVSALLDAVALLHELNEECKSLWQMLDDIKASEIENHADLLRKEIETKMDEVRALASTTVGEA
jgi:glutamine synthetase type III